MVAVVDGAAVVLGTVLSGEVVAADPVVVVMSTGDVEVVLGGWVVVVVGASSSPHAARETLAISNRSTLRISTQKRFPFPASSKPVTALQ